MYETPPHSPHATPPASPQTRGASGSVSQRPADAATIVTSTSDAYVLDASGRARGIKQPLRGISEAVLRPWHIIEDDGVVIDQLCRIWKETFIMKADLQVTTEEGNAMSRKNRCVVLTRESYIEIKLTAAPPHDLLPDPYAPSCLAYGSVIQALKEKEAKEMDEVIAGNPNNNSIDQIVANVRLRDKKHKSWLDFHSANAHPREANAIVLLFFSGSASKNIALGFSKMKRWFSGGGGSQSGFGDFLKSKTIRCRSPEEALQWLWVIQRLLRDAWQQKFESSVCPEPEVYKKHAFVIKKGNERCLVVTDKWMYNVEVAYKPTTVKSIKWAIPISTLTSVSLVGDGTPADAIIAFDEEAAMKSVDKSHPFKQKGEMKKDHTWTFVDVKERASFIDTLCRCYWELNRSHLPVLRQA